MRDTEWARKRRWTCSSPLLLSLHPIKLLLFGLRRTWQLNDEVAATPRRARHWKGNSSRAHAYTLRTHTYTIHTPRGLPSRVPVRAVSAVTWVSLSLWVLWCARGRERERERERERKRFIAPSCPPSDPCHAARLPIYETTLASAAARLERGVTCASSYIARRNGGTEEKVVRTV